jgi:hypothetical protein
MTAIAFMVMPFGRKRPTVNGAGIPREVDFDALWHEVHKPVLESLGYVAVRADEDVGAIIVLEMISRLAAADLVVADVSLANSNVYYEIGVRHAAKRTHSVLVAADWGEPVFDLDQIRQARYPLTDGDLNDPAAAAAARAALTDKLPPLARGESPFYQAVPHYPEVEQTAFADYFAQLNEFGTAVRTIRLTADDHRRAELTRDLVATQGGRQAVQESVVLELVRLVRDNLTWAELTDYIDALPDPQRRHPAVVEQRALALSEQGELLRAAGALEQLIEQAGATSERLGLLGGRYKRLYREATDEPQRRRYLERAIDAYERGMRADLNDFYPSSNLPRLYRRRADEGDERRAREAAAVVLIACQASVDRQPADDHWASQTMLGAAFDTGDPAAARAVLRGMRRQLIPAWKIASTANDLQESLALLPPSADRDELGRVLAEVRALAT